VLIFSNNLICRNISNFLVIGLCLNATYLSVHICKIWLSFDLFPKHDITFPSCRNFSADLVHELTLSGICRTTSNIIWPACIILIWSSKVFFIRYMQIHQSWRNERYWTIPTGQLGSSLSCREEPSPINIKIWLLRIYSFT